MTEPEMDQELRPLAERYLWIQNYVINHSGCSKVEVARQLHAEFGVSESGAFKTIDRAIDMGLIAASYPADLKQPRASLTATDVRIMPVTATAREVRALWDAANNAPTSRYSSGVLDTIEALTGVIDMATFLERVSSNGN